MQRLVCCHEKEHPLQVHPMYDCMLAAVCHTCLKWSALDLVFFRFLPKQENVHEKSSKMFLTIGIYCLLSEASANAGSLALDES